MRENCCKHTWCVALEVVRSSPLRVNYIRGNPNRKHRVLRATNFNVQVPSSPSVFALSIARSMNGCGFANAMRSASIEPHPTIEWTFQPWPFIRVMRSLLPPVVIPPHSCVDPSLRTPQREVTCNHPQTSECVAPCASAACRVCVCVCVCLCVLTRNE